MKIAFSGASSTGKSTVRSELYEQGLFTSLPVRNVNSRAIIKSLGYSSMDAMPNEAYCVFQVMHISQKIQIEAENSSFLTERQFGDALCYWRLLCAPNASELQNSLIDRLCFSHIANYDLIFYFPFGAIDFHDDGYRSRDQDFHRRFDECLRAIYQGNRVPYITVPAGTPTERANFVAREVQKCMK